ncbi:ABC transporter permease [Corynebacterium sp.]|uniref:ABC transporter permease n=1 Tax=Corynebacterium sp. TaxID=1720 RepID=UPI0025BC8E04|nr:ABC transporter permease [Corynebacterium sp.]
MNSITSGLILTTRELRHWRRQPLTPVFSIMFTVMLLLMFSLLFGGSISLPGGGDYIDFLLPGMMALTMMFGVEATTSAMAADARKGITDRFRSLPIGDTSVAFGRVGADMITSVVELAVLVAGGTLLGWRVSGSAGEAFLAVGLLLWFRFAVLWIGIYLGLTVGKNDGATTMVQVLVWPVGFLSTAFVSPEYMPSWLAPLATWNPVSATATAVRELFGNPVGFTGGDLAGHAVLAAVLWPLALVTVFLPLSARAYRTLRR